MNRPSAITPKPVTPQRVRAVLRKAGHDSFRDSGGSFVSLRPCGSIAVEFIAGTIMVGSEKHTMKLTLYAAALAAAGLACEVREGAVWVRVEQQTREVSS